MGWWSDIQKARNDSGRLKEESAKAEREYDEYQAQQAAPAAAPSPHAIEQGLRTKTTADDAPASIQDTLERIAAEPPLVPKAKDKLQAHNIDPLDPNNLTPPSMQGGRHPGSTMLGLSMDFLDLISKVPLVDAFLSARVLQVAEHGIPQMHPFEVGYRIQLRDPKQRSSEAAQKRAQEISRWVFTCGDPRLREFNTFENHLKAGVRDSMIYDQYCAEVVYGWGKQPGGVVGVDARTIRRAQPTTAELDNLRYGAPNKGHKYVQILRNEIVAEWDIDHFIFGVRNPRTDIRANGYGYPELERLVNTVGDAVNAMMFNASNFRNGTHATGILALMSAMDQNMFDAWSDQVRAMTSGASNAHRVLTVKLDPEQKESLNFTGLNSTNKDMEYSSWLSFLLKVIAAVLQMDPAEIGFVYGNEGQSGTLSQAGPGERIASSKERGLRPILRSFQTFWNYKVIYNIDPDFELVLAGFDKATELLKQEFLSKVVRTHWTVNEIRAIDDLPPLATPAASLGPSDGVFQSAMQYYENQQMQKEQEAKQQAAAEAGMGDPNDVLPGTDPQAGGQISDADLAQMFGDTQDDGAPGMADDAVVDALPVAKSITFEVR